MSKEEEDDTAKKLHLGGLSPTLTESDLREYFENYGRVVSIQIMPPPTPRAPSTYGFITFFDEEAVRRVMADGQNGKIIIGGREVSVNPAKRRQRHQPREKMEDYSNWYSSNDNSTYAGYGTNNSSYSNNNNNSIYNNSSSNNNRSKGHDGDDDDDDDSSDEVITKLFVGGIPEQVNSAALKKYFEQFGEVPYVEMIIDPKTLKRRGYGFVTFADPNVAKEVLKMRTTEIDGSTVITEKKALNFFKCFIFFSFAFF